MKSALIVRQDYLFCPRCKCIEPIHPGDGAPIDTYLMALEQASERHPDKPHENPFALKCLGVNEKGR